MKLNFQKILINKRKLTVKDYLKNKDVRMDEMINTENRDEKALHFCILCLCYFQFCPAKHAFFSF